MLNNPGIFLIFLNQNNMRDPNSVGRTTSGAERQVMLDQLKRAATAPTASPEVDKGRTDTAKKAQVAATPE